MTSLKEENPDLYAKQFSRFVKAGIQPTSVRFISNLSREKIKFIHISFFQFEALYKAAHAAIRADPSPAKKKEQKADAPKPKR